MNLWRHDTGGIVQLAHPRTGSESVRDALLRSGEVEALEKQHRVRWDHPCLLDTEYQVVVNIRNPFDIMASWKQARENMGDHRPLPEVVTWMKGQLAQYTQGRPHDLFYLISFADTVLITERLKADWKNKVQSRWPVADIAHLNAVPNKRPWLNYFVEEPEAIDVMWKLFGRDCIVYENHLGRSVLPR